jgi:tetrahydromethanopterin S-methyltransferase subunit G
MPVRTPLKLKEKIGDEATEELLTWIIETIRETSITRDEYHQVLSRLDLIERDVFDLKDEVKELRREMNGLRSEMNERFDKMNERFDKMNERFDKINERFDIMYGRMGSFVKWTVGTLALFGTLITALLAIGQFLR